MPRFNFDACSIGNAAVDRAAFTFTHRVSNTYSNHPAFSNRAANGNTFTDIHPSTNRDASTFFHTNPNKSSARAARLYIQNFTTRCGAAAVHHKHL